MSDTISVPLTPQQVEEFARLARDEQAARLTVERTPIATNYAARAIVLGSYPLAMFDGKNLNIDLAGACIQFAPNTAPLALMPSEATG